MSVDRRGRAAALPWHASAGAPRHSFELSLLPPSYNPQDGMILIATQLMPRGSLRATLCNPAAREELSWRRRGSRIALDVAEALDYMHTQQRMLHSDIKVRHWGG